MPHRVHPIRLVVALAALCVTAAAVNGANATTVLHISSHLPKAARASLDGGKSIGAPGYGSTNIPAAAGHHVLTVTTAAGVTYKADLDLKPGALLTWRHRGYWCVNLLERSLETYSHDDCQEEVEDAG